MRKFLMMVISVLMTMMVTVSANMIPIYTANAADSTAYAVFNTNTGELDFVRSTETHSNSSTGTVRSISGGSYTGTIYAGFENSNDIPWSSNLAKIKSVQFVDAIRPSSTASWFKGMSNCDSIDLAKLDTSNAKDMGAMFYDCSSLQNIDLKNFNTSKATNMSGMFENCSALQSINVKSFDTSKVTDMSDMFDGCYSLQSLDVTNFDTSNVTNMSLMFNYCYALQSLDLSSFNTTKVKKMTYMFNMCQNLNKMTFGKNFKVASSHSAMFATPYTTASGKDSTGQWGLGSESAYKTYSSYSLASYGTRTGALAGTWYAQADSSIVTYTDSISHWANGFKNKEGNNNDKSSFLLGKTSFSQEAASKYSLDSSKATTIPNGFKLSDGFDSASIDGTKKHYDFDASITQKSEAMNYEYNYEPITYTISYQLNGGTNNSANPSSYNVLYGVTFSDPVKTGYTFTGWTMNDQSTNGINTGKNATFTDSSDLYDQLASRMTGNKTVTANWKANEYTIHFEGNGNSDGSMSDESMTYDTEKALTANQFTKTGYKFTGWNTKADGTGTKYDDKEKIKNLTAKNGDTITLYAQWKQASMKPLAFTGGQAGLMILIIAVAIYLLVRANKKIDK